MEYTAFNLAAWNPLHSIGMLWAMLHKIHCILSGCIGPRCIDSTAYNRDPLHHNAWILLHLMTLHGIHCIQSCSTPPHCTESTAFNRDPLGHAAWNPLHSIGIHLTPLYGIHCVQLGCILPCCMESTAFNDTAWNPLHQS